ncbi:hypothetical protein BGZ51_004432 [Haplosporangium sp. Z 767]|nr:hypothetical protein BGZ50_001783 [Haplosporangium sp. Z 11]KAF9192977.1 hypothetical protein BGZ51_004432 [Haplosporangium sp. Z 767]
MSGPLLSVAPAGESTPASDSELSSPPIITDAIDDTSMDEAPGAKDDLLDLMDDLSSAGESEESTALINGKNKLSKRTSRSQEMIEACMEPSSKRTKQNCSQSQSSADQNHGQSQQQDDQERQDQQEQQDQLTPEQQLQQQARRQRDNELDEEEYALRRQQLFQHRPTNPLDLPEIRANVGRFLSRRELRNCILVSEGWWESFMPFLWMDLRPVYKNVLGGTKEYPPARQMRKYSHFIRTFEYNGHGTVLLSMLPTENLYGSQHYNDNEIEWRKSEEEIEQEQFGYLDDDAVDDIDGDWSTMDPDMTLSDYEDQIETRRIEREAKLMGMKDVIAANRRRNEVSRFLNDNTNYRARACNQLERLILTDKRFSRERGCYYRNWIALIQINRTKLKAVELQFGIRSFEAFRDFFNAVVTLKQLTELTLFDNDIDGHKAKTFLEQVCVRLTKLRMRNVRVEYAAPPQQPQQGQAGTGANIPGNVATKIPLMKKMKSLSLNRVHARQNSFPLDFIKMCPNIVELHFQPQWGLPVKEISEILSDKTPEVTHLTFMATGMSDMDASLVIKSVACIQKLDFSYSVFGLMATNNLMMRHNFTLTELDIRHCTQTTGSMIQRILGECRNLQSFMADFIRAQEVVNNSVYSSWACIGLKKLTIDFRGNPKDRELNLRVYRQLSQLTCLEYLDVSRSYSNANTTASMDPQWKEYSNSLTFGLDSGLKELRTLVHLNQFVYRGIVHNDIGLTEIKWMAKAWPRLEFIGGKIQERRASKYNPNVHPIVQPIENSTSSDHDGSTITVNSALSNAATVASSSSGTSSTTGNRRPITRIKQEPPPNLLAIVLRRLKLNHRIRVIPHSEDKVSPAQRRRNKYLFGESSDEEQDYLRPGQSDPRYRF